ncbi:helix-turn-helix domain-containing protein [Methylophilus luteus]|uniref:Helix-turn-helix domain-containing protein n=1 Tax=Methylophilus luteus TaxID=640108 RepID=A0ABW3F8S4_9PROT
MQVTSEDNINVSAPNTEAADKPKRGRKRKVDTEATPTLVPATGVEAQTYDPLTPTLTGDTHSMQPSTPETATPLIEETPPIEETPIVTLPGSGCGNVLKAARETQGLSIHEVSSHLRLGPKQIQAIEQDDFDKLPQPSIVRGFIRNYAKLLNIDVTPVLAAYQRIVPSTAPLPLSVRSNASPSVIDKPARTIRPQRILTFFIFLILAAILAYFYINHIKPQALKNASLALDVDEISETTGQDINVPPAVTETVSLPAAADATATTGQAAAPATATATEPAAGIAPEAATTQTQAQVAEPAAVATSTPDSTIVSTPTPAANNAVESTTLKSADPQKAILVFRVTEDSWVRIEDMQGKKILSEVLSAGSEHNVVAEKPVNVIVGHAQGTQLTIDNQPYDLTQATRGRVARIQLK